jgi:hypothetical protein
VPRRRNPPADADGSGIISRVIRACGSAVRERYGNLCGIGKETAFKHPEQGRQAAGQAPMRSQLRVDFPLHGRGRGFESLIAHQQETTLYLRKRVEGLLRRPKRSWQHSSTPLSAPSDQRTPRPRTRRPKKSSCSTRPPVVVQATALCLQHRAGT